MENEVTVTIGKEKYTSTVHFEKHSILADEPEELGGQDLGFSPTALLLSSLGSCKAITMRMYADRKNWPLEGIELRLASKVDKSEAQQKTIIHCDIQLIGNLTDEQKRRIHIISEKCPIHKILSNPITIESNLVQ